MSPKNYRKTDETPLTAQPIAKTPTHIAGLDEVLCGGIPTGRLTIVNGGPGAGKTMLGLESLFHSAQSGEPAVFISFEETGDALRRNGKALGWDLNGLEEAGKLALIDPELDFDALTSGDFGIEGLLAILEGHTCRIGAQLVGIDAVDMLMRLFDDPVRARNQLITLHRWLVAHELTTIMTLKTDRTGAMQSGYGYLDFMADCVIVMDQRIRDQVNTRRLRVMKYRGSDFSGREHPFVIADRGIVIMPLTSLDLVQQSTGAFVSTADRKLDSILGGGLRKSSSILVSGPSGSGKTTLSVLLIEAAARREERVLFLSFEQSAQTLISEMQSVGFSLGPLIENEVMRVSPIMPETLGMEDHLYRIIREMDEFQPEHLVLDGISATSRIGSAQAALELLIRLYHAAKTRGITCIYTNQTRPSTEDGYEISGIGISSLVDTAILLNFFRKEDRVCRSLLVLKSRGTRHSDRYHEFNITDNGIILEKSPIQA